MQARFSLMVACALVLCSTFAFAPQAHADPTKKDPVAQDGDSTGDRVLSAEESLAADIAAVARAENVSLERATDLMKGQQNFTAAADSIKAANPSGFVSAVWDGSTSAKTAIYVNYTPKEATRSGIPIRRATAMSETSREALQARIVSKLATLVGAENVGVGIDPLTGVAAIEFQPTSVPMETKTPRTSREAKVTPETVRTALQDLDRDLAAKAEIHESSGIALPQYGSGGNWGGQSCTAAFTATRGGKPAITTTAHCPSVSSYDGARLSSRLNSTLANGDVSSYLATGGAITNKIRWAMGQYRYITSVADPAYAGLRVCHFGVGSAKSGSGHSCATVLYSSYTVGSRGKLVIVDREVSVNGDSGGPWFDNQGARGIHYGACYVDRAYRSCFTKITSLNSIGTAVYVGK